MGVRTRTATASADLYLSGSSLILLLWLLFQGSTQCVRVGLMGYPVAEVVDHAYGLYLHDIPLRMLLKKKLNNVNRHLYHIILFNFRRLLYSDFRAIQNLHCGPGLLWASSRGVLHST